MQLPLSDADLASFALAVLLFELLDVRFELVEMVDSVVGDADGSDLACLLRFNESAPAAFSGFDATVRGVD
jgi:hypothetical protein